MGVGYSTISKWVKQLREKRRGILLPPTEEKITSAIVASQLFGNYERKYDVLFKKLINILY